MGHIQGMAQVGPTIGSLFSGIGGLELGLERAGLGRTVWQVEQDPLCRRILRRHWPDAVRYSEIETVDTATLPRVDIVCGGFPCQDESSANLRAVGLSGARSGLWFEYLRIVSDLRPTVVVVENVSGLRTRGDLDTVLRSLAGIGYRVYASEFEAATVGAPFRGSRLFVVATAHGNRQSVSALYAEMARRTPDAGGLGQWRMPFAGPGRVAHGVSARVDRARTGRLGNAVVPLMAYEVGLFIRKILKPKPFGVPEKA